MRQRYILVFLAFVLVMVSGCYTIKKKKNVKVAEGLNVPSVDVNIKKKYKKLKKKLYSKDPNIQTAAAVSLLDLEYQGAFELLINILKDAKDKKITTSVLKAFGFTGNDRALGQTISLLDNKKERIRLAAAASLGKINTFKAHKVMIYNLLNSHVSTRTRILVAGSLGDVRNRDSVEPLINILKSKDADLQTAALNALVKITRQPIGRDIDHWKEWWALNRIKSREEWLEDIVEYLDENLKQLESENEALNKEITGKSIELLELYASNNSGFSIFIEAVKSKYPDVRVFAVNALAKMKPPEAKEIFLELLTDENVEVKIIAAHAIGEIADKSTLEPLLDVVHDKNTEVQVAIVKALGRIKMPKAEDALISLLKSKKTKVTGAAIEALGQIGDSTVIAHLIPFLQNSDPLVRETVTIALGKIKDSRSIDPLIKALSDKVERVRWYAADSLGKLKVVKAVGPLISLLSDSSARVRESATTSLGQIGDEQAVEYLTKMLDDKDKRVVEQASEALLVIAGDRLESNDDLANIFVIKKDYDRAIKIAEKQLAKYSENEDALWQSRLRLAKYFVLAENWDKAANLFATLTKHFPKDVELKKEFVHCTIEMKQYERSLDALADWVNGRHNNKEFYWKSILEIATIIFDNGEFETAKEIVNRFEDKNPELGGNDLKSDFNSLREKCIIKIEKANSRDKGTEGSGCLKINNNFLAETDAYYLYYARVV
ncbi:MAG: HEAT repeat domain-containing protein [Candidatus Anammoxibacter sp.]